jgi:hypothetical protein
LPAGGDEEQHARAGAGPDDREAIADPAHQGVGQQHAHRPGGDHARHAARGFGRFPFGGQFEDVRIGDPPRDSQHQEGGQDENALPSRQRGEQQQ